MKKKIKYFVFALFVLPFMVLFTACGKSVDFKINFVVDDVIYDTIKTEGNSTISMPNDPEKEGYVFDGWYWDKDVWSKPFTANSLLDAPLKKDLNLYAKFVIIHDHDLVHVDSVSPNCTENGNIEHYHCLSCLKNFSDELGQNEIENVVLSKMGHVKSSYVELVPATCTEKGSEQSTCLICHEILDTREIPAKGHKSSYWTVVTPATCTEKGSEQISCSVCHEVLNTREISAKGHSPENWTVVTPATCEEKGSEQISCSVCYEVLDTREIPAKGHRFGKWVTEEEATYYETGTKRKDCMDCDHYETEDIPKLIANVVDPTNVRVEFGILKWDGYSPFGFEIVINGSSFVVKVKEEQNETSNNDDNFMDLTNGDRYEINLYTNSFSGYNFARVNVKDDKEIQILDANELEVELKSDDYNEVKIASIYVDDSRSEYAILKDFAVNAPVTNLHFIDDGENVTFTWDSPSSLYDYTFIFGNTEKTVDKAKKSYTVARKSLEEGSVVSVYVQGIESAKFYPSKKNTITLQQLDAPVLSIDKLNISWESIANADNYKVKALTTEIISNTYYSYDGANAGEHTITVMAFGADRLNNSSTLTFKKLVRPEISIENGIVTWNAIAGQLKYATLNNNIETKFVYKSFKISDLNDDFDIYFYASPVQENSMQSDRVIISKFACGEYSTLYVGNQIGDVKTYSYPELTNILYIPIEFEDCDFSKINKNVKLIARKVPSSLDDSLVTEIIVLDGTTEIETFGNCSNLTKISIPSSVTNIGSSAFSGCSLLESVTFEENSNLKSIWASVFSGCSSLTSITIPSSVTSIGSSAFSGCSSLESVTFEEGSKCENIRDYAFINCSSLTSITILSSVTSIGSSAFYGCSSLETLTFEEGSKCESIGKLAFSGCSSLIEMTLPFVGASSNKTASDTYQYPFGYIFGTSTYTGGTAVTQYYYGSSINSTTCSTYYIPSNLQKVTILGGNILYGAFYNCSMLTEIIISENITSIGDLAFRGCSSLINITISSSVTSIGSSAFRYCSSLESITIPSSVTGVGVYSFCGCSSLKSVTFEEGSNLKSIGNQAFYDCSSLKSITIPSSVTGVGSYAFNGCSSLESVIFEEGSKCENIGDYAFHDCSSLTSITIPSSVTSIGSYAFCGCLLLESIIIPSSVTNIGSSVFSGCDLETIQVDINNEVYASPNNCNAIIEISINTLIVGCKNTLISNDVTSISNYAFSYCSSLTSITIPSSVTSIGSYAFYGCSSLESVTFEENSNLKSIWASVFRGCSSLKSITIPSSVTSIGSYAFNGCSSLESVLFEEGSKCESIGNYAFENCSSLTSITIPSSVTSIGNYAFRYCSSLESVAFEDDSKLTGIDSLVFSDCLSLHEIMIPKSVITICENAFINCSSLTQVYYGGSKSDWNDIYMYSCYNSSLTNATIYYYSEEEPAGDGNYWHFVDGVVTEWVKG